MRHSKVCTSDDSVHVGICQSRPYEVDRAALAFAPAAHSHKVRLCSGPFSFIPFDSRLNLSGKNDTIVVLKCSSFTLHPAGLLEEVQVNSALLHPSTAYPTGTASNTAGVVLLPSYLAFDGDQRAPPGPTLSTFEFHPATSPATSFWCQ